MQIDEDGFIAKKEVGDKLICVMPLLFGRARIGVGPKDANWFDDSW